MSRPSPSPAPSLALLLALLPALFIAGCVPKKPELEPPGVRIADLALTGGGGYELSLRISNRSDVVLPGHRLVLGFRLDGGAVDEFDHQVTVDIPPRGSELIRLQGRFDDAQVSALDALTEGRRGQLPYDLEGRAEAGGRVLEVDYQGWLSASPGQPGRFR